MIGYDLCDDRPGGLEWYDHCRLGRGWLAWRRSGGLFAVEHLAFLSVAEGCRDLCRASRVRSKRQRVPGFESAMSDGTKTVTDKNLGLTRRFG
jgi:hypothetical protein